MKSFLSGLAYVFLMGAALFIFMGCGIMTRNPQTTIVSIMIDSDALLDVYDAEAFMLDDIRILVQKGDGTLETVLLDESMLSTEDLAKLTTPGTHTIIVTYNQHTVPLTLTIVRYTELDRMLMQLFDMGVAEGIIDSSYEAWLDEVRGEDGRGIESVRINDDGELIIVYTDGVEENLGHLITLHVVTFLDEDGTVLHVEAVMDGYSARGPIEPTRAGQVFSGWDQSLFEIRADMTVTALYEVRESTLRFDTNGGSPVIPLKALSGTAIEEPTSPSRAYYYFDGWYEDETLTEPFIFEAMPENDIWLYAKWVPRLNFDVLKTIMIDNENHTKQGSTYVDDIMITTFSMQQDHTLSVMSYTQTEGILPDGLKSFNAFMTEEDGASVAYFYYDEGDCHERVLLPPLTSFALLLLFDYSALLPANLMPHWFEREGNLYSLRAEYHDALLQIMHLNPETHTVEAYSIELDDDGFAISFTMLAPQGRTERNYSRTNIGLTDVQPYGFDACPANYVGLSYEIGDEGVTITGYEGISSIVVLPDTLEGYPVIAIGMNAFAFSPVVSVKIPDSVTTIGNQAFIYASRLEEMHFGENSQLTSIGQSAFENAIKLKFIQLPNSVTHIGSTAFANTSALRTLTLPESLTIIESSVFNGSGLTSMHVPASITDIKQSAFRQSTALSQLTFEDGSLLETIESQAFSGTKLRAISLPDALTTIGYRAFSGSALKQIYLPIHVMHIDAEAFMGNPGLDIYAASTEAGVDWHPQWNVNHYNVIWEWHFDLDSLLETLLAITNYTESFIMESERPIASFEYKSTLEALHLIDYSDLHTLLEYYATIYYDIFVHYAFNSELYCWDVSLISETDFENLQKPLSLSLVLAPHLDGDAFEASFNTLTLKDAYKSTMLEHLYPGAEDLSLISYTIELIGNNYIFSVLIGSDGEDIEIHYTISNIGTTVLTMPSWNLCNVPEELLWAYYIEDEEAVITAYLGQDETIIIPDSLNGYPVTKIDDHAFTETPWFVYVTIPETVKHIGAYAFFGQDELTSVTFTGESTLEAIGDFAFMNANHLQTIILPITVIDIGYWAFKQCSSLIIFTLLDGEAILWDDWNPDSRPVISGFVPGELIPEYYSSIFNVYGAVSINDQIIIEGIVMATFTTGYIIYDANHWALTVYDEDYTVAVGDKVQIIATFGMVGSQGNVFDVVNMTVLSQNNTLTPYIQHTDVSSIIYSDLESPDDQGRIFNVGGMIHIDESDQVFIARYLAYEDDYGNHYEIILDDKIQISGLSHPASLQALKAVEGEMIIVDLFLFTVHETEGITLLFDGNEDDISVIEKLITYDDFEILHQESELGYGRSVIGTVIAIFNGGFILYDGTHTLLVHTYTYFPVNVGDYVRTGGEYSMAYYAYKINNAMSYILVESGVTFDLTPIEATLADLQAIDIEDKLAHGLLYRITGTVEIEPIFGHVVLRDGDRTVLISNRSPFSSIDLLKTFEDRVVTIDVYFYTSSHMFLEEVEVIFDGDETTIIEEDEPFGVLDWHFDFEGDYADTYTTEPTNTSFLNLVDDTLFTIVLYRGAVNRSHFVMYSTDAMILSPRLGSGETGIAYAILDFDEADINTIRFETYFWNDTAEPFFERYELQGWNATTETWELCYDLLPVITGTDHVVTIVLRDVEHTKFRFYTEGGGMNTDSARVLIDNLRIYTTEE